MDTIRPDRKSRLSIALIAALGGVLLYAITNTWIAPTPGLTNNHAPEYARPVVGSAAADVDPQTVSVRTQAGENAANGTIVGRVLGTDNRAVPECVVTLNSHAPGYQAAVSVPTDAEGYFSCEVPRGNYRVIATAPSRCMFPSQPCQAAADGPPVTMYLHNCMVFSLVVLDAVTNQPIALPSDSVVRITIDGKEVPDNKMLQTIPELWRRGARNAQDAPLGRSVVRVVGTAFDDALRMNRPVRVEVRANGLSVRPVTLSASEALSGERIVQTTSEVLPGRVAQYLSVRYASGEFLSSPFVMEIDLPCGERLQYWGIDPKTPPLVILERGKCFVSAGVFTVAMQQIAVDVSGAAYGTVGVAIERRADILIRMVDPRTWAAVAFGDIEVVRKPAPPGDRGLSFKSAAWSSDSYRLVDLIPGAYSVRVTDALGRPHQDHVTLVGAGESVLTFQSSAVR